MPAGRPIEYTREVTKKLAEKLVEHFDVEHTKVILERFYYKNGDEKEKEIEIANELPTIEGFCKEVDMSKDTLHRLIKMTEPVSNKEVLVHPELSDAYKRARTMQEDMWLKVSLKGLYPGAFTIFAGKNMFGWRDKTETDITSGGKPIGHIIDELDE